MARPKVKLDHGAIAALLKGGEIAGMVADATEAVAGNARGQGVQVEGEPGEVDVPIETQMVTTDRAHGLVTIAHPSGEAVQAKHGLLTQAAAAAGLEVKSK